MVSGSVSTSSKPMFPRARAKLSVPLRLPREHGAAVCFTLATVLAVRSGWSAVDSLVIPLGLLWLTFLLSHRPTQAFWFALAAAVVLAILGDPASLAPLIALFGAGIRVTSTVAATFGTVWRELLAMMAVAAMPLLAATIATGAEPTGYTVTLAFSAAAVTAAGMIHVLRRDSDRIKPFLWFSVFFWMWLWAQEPGAVLPCLIPFLPQPFLLFVNKQPSFKLLGVLETAAMLWVLVSCWNMI